MSVSQSGRQSVSPLDSVSVRLLSVCRSVYEAGSTADLLYVSQSVTLSANLSRRECHVSKMTRMAFIRH